MVLFPIHSAVVAAAGVVGLGGFVFGRRGRLLVGVVGHLLRFLVQGKSLRIVDANSRTEGPLQAVGREVVLGLRICFQRRILETN